jgi:polar amino acid transport system substrate-binding protein
MVEQERTLGMNIRTLVAANAAFWLCGLVGIAAAVADDAKCEPQGIASKYPGLAGRTLKIGVSAADKPATFRDEKDPSIITGFDAEYARAAFGCIGAPIEFSVGGWSGLLPSLVAGQIDVMWDQLYYTQERAKSVDYVLYSSSRSAIVASKGNPKHIKGFGDLCGLRAVSQVGSIEVAALRRQSQACTDANKPAIDIVIGQDRPSSLRELQNGRADAYVGIGVGVAYDPTLFEIAYLFNAGIKVGVGVRKGNAELARALAASIGILQANGTARRLYEAFALSPELSVPAEIVTQ